MTSPSPARPDTRPPAGPAQGQAARRPGRPDPRTVLVAVLAGALTLAGVVGLGWVTSADQRAAMRATNSRPYAVPDGGWAQGAHQEWSAQAAAGAEVVAAGDWVITVERSGSTDTQATLTGYEVSASGATQTWSTTADLTTGTLAEAPFQVWDGSTLVHGNTLVDLSSGTVSAAPWQASSRPLVFEDRVVTCPSDDSCQAWAPGATTPQWTAQVSNAHEELKAVDVPAVIYHRDGARYAIIGLHAVVDLDTGETVPFTLPALQSWAIASASDGWTVASWDTKQEHWHIYAFDLKGGTATDEYDGTVPWVADEVPLYTPYPRTREQYRDLWVEGDTSAGIYGWAFHQANGTCYARFNAVDGPSIEIPTITTGGAVNVISQTTFSCAGGFVTSYDNSVTTVNLESRPTENAFAFMYATATGEAVTFEGTDVMGGDQLTMVDERLVVGYDTDTGTLYGYTPAG